MKRIKLIANLAKIGLVVLMMTGIGCQQKPEVKSEIQLKTEEAVTQLFNDLQKLSQDTKESKGYLAIIEKLTNFVREEVKKNPEGNQAFIQEIIDLAVRTGPGLALQIADYADAKLREEREQLQKEKAEKEKEISQLRQQLIQTQRQIANFQQEVKGKQKQVLILQEERDGFSSQVVRLQKELNQAQELKQKKEEEVKKLKSRLPPENEVSVILINDRNRYGNIRNFRIISESTGEVWLFSNIKEEVDGNLAPGKYIVEYTSQGRNGFQSSPQRDTMVVFSKPSFFYKNKWYYGHFGGR